MPAVPSRHCRSQKNCSRERGSGREVLQQGMGQRKAGGSLLPSTAPVESAAGKHLLLFFAADSLTKVAELTYKY